MSNHLYSHGFRVYFALFPKASLVLNDFTARFSNTKPFCLPKNRSRTGRFSMPRMPYLSLFVLYLACFYLCSIKYPYFWPSHQFYLFLTTSNRTVCFFFPSSYTLPLSHFNYSLCSRLHQNSYFLIVFLCLKLITMKLLASSWYSFIKSSPSTALNQLSSLFMQIL